MVYDNVDSEARYRECAKKMDLSHPLNSHAVSCIYER